MYKIRVYPIFSQFLCVKMCKNRSVYLLEKKMLKLCYHKTIEMLLIIIPRFFIPSFAQFNIYSYSCILFQEGREHWVVYYTSPQSLMMTFSYSLA